MSDITPSLAAFVPPDLRVVNIRAALVAGYPAQRLQVGLPFAQANSYSLAASVAHITNNGTADVVVKLAETDNETSGTRYSLGAVKIVPGGRRQISFTPSRKFVEVIGVAGSGPVLLEIATKAEWSEVGFSGQRDSRLPAVAYANNPTAPTSAKQDFTSNTSWVVVHNLGYVATPTLLDTTGADITALATISSVTINGYTATFSPAKAGSAYSTV